MLRRTALAAATLITIGIVACVSDDRVDPIASKDAGAEAQTSTSSSSGSSGGGTDYTVNAVTNGPNLCGLLTENPFPSCPGLGAHDTNCTQDGKSACCPGIGCIAGTDTCKAPAVGAPKPFECFAGEQCNVGFKGDAYPTVCCAQGTMESDTVHQNNCGVAERLTLTAGDRTFCSATCDTLQICRIEGDAKDKCKKGTCKETIISIPNPNGGEPYIRKVGVCR